MPETKSREDESLPFKVNTLIAQLKIDQDQFRKHRALIITIESLLRQEPVFLESLADHVGLHDEELQDFLCACRVAPSNEPLFNIAERTVEQIQTFITFSDAVRP